MKLYINKLILFCLKYFLTWKYSLLAPYMQGLMVQAKFLYKQSDLFKARYQIFGIEFAEQTFEQNVFYFFQKAKQEPFIIRAKIFFDATLGKAPKPYYM